MLCFLPLAIFAQEAEMDMAESEHYVVYSELGTAQARETAERMDAFFDFYNRYFHFDQEKLDHRLQVKIFENKDNFDAYLKTIIPEEKDSFVFLQYSDPEKSELVGYWSNQEEFDTYLSHHGVIQFIKAFVPYPPLWLQKGFAVYFEKCTYSSEKKQVVYVENLSWLYSLKNYTNQTETGSGVKQLMPFPTLLTLDTSSANAEIDVFYAQSWGLVHFLMNSHRKEYNRVLWDSLLLIDPYFTKQENDRAVIQHAFEWVSKKDFVSDFEQYVLQLKTFPDLVQEGMELYARGEYNRAEINFIDAVSMNEEHPVPYYYLGLISYVKGDYSMAEYYYQNAVTLGAEQGITLYALGVNAFADSRYEEALDYLAQAGSADPDGYAEKSASLEARITEEMAKEEPESGEESEEMDAE